MDGSERIGAVNWSIKFLLSRAVGGALPVSLKFMPELEPEIPIPPAQPNPNPWNNIRTGLYIIATLVLFVFALDLMVSSLQHLGKSAAETIILATSNPFTGLFIGLLITAMIQSSSTTTAMVVALV